MAMTGKEYGSKPAFPSSRVEEEVRAKVAYQEGVTKQEIFAALALMGYIAAHSGGDVAMPNEVSAAEVAVAYADALCDALCEALAKDGAA